MVRRISFRYQVKLVECFFVLIILVAFVWLVLHLSAKVNCEDETQYQSIAERPELPSLIEIQKMLNELEPDNPIKVDGIYGPKTKEKWERVWMNEQAIKYFTKGENHERKS